MRITKNNITLTHPITLSLLNLCEKEIESKKFRRNYVY